MGIIRVIKQNELQEGTSEEPIYPITSIEAIYDLDNKKLSTLIGTINTKIQDLNTGVSRVIANTQNIALDVSILELQIVEVKQSLENFELNINQQLSTIKQPYISFKGVLSGASPEIRGTSNTGNHNVECSSSFNVSEISCEILNLEDVNPGEAWFITKPGDYIINNETFNVNNLSIIQCVESNTEKGYKFNVYDLGIPFIPAPTQNDIGKTLKVADNKTLYWG